MHKTEFIALAAVAKRIRAQENQGVSNRVINLLADFCASQSSTFSRERWLGYVLGANGPSGGKVEITEA